MPGQPNLIFDKDVPITAGDGNVLRANIFRPVVAGRYPVILSHGVYGKDIHFADGYKPQWESLTKVYPGLVGEGSTGRFLRWETCDPERFVPDGYVVVQVDSRGTGKSPGFLDPRGPREMQDYYDCIEWAGTQSWSNGKVGLLGISYYAFTQWAVAALKPPHLAAICPWEGFTDYYRDSTHQGGIFSNVFTTAWWPRQVLVNQYGNAATTHRDRDTGERTTGGPALSEAQLAANRSDYPGDLARHTLADEWYRERTPELSRITVPVLSAGNWGGPGLHLRGNIEGFLGVASEHKWLSLHTGTHWESFYLPQYVALQKRFFDWALKGIDNGWRDEPPVRLEVRRPDGDRIVSTTRFEREFPPARTKWTKVHLDAASRRLVAGQSSSGKLGRVRGDGRGRRLRDRFRRGNRDLRFRHVAIVGGEHNGRHGHFRVAARVRRCGARDPDRRRARADDDGQGLAARVTSQARSGAHDAPSRVSCARRGAEDRAGQVLCRRCRDLADQHGFSGGLPDGAHPHGAGFRVPRTAGPDAPQPPTRSQSRGIRGHQHDRDRRRARVVSAAADRAEGVRGDRAECG